MTETNLATDYFYIYGVILKEELQRSKVPPILGIDQNPTTLKIYQDLAVIVTPVNAQDFSQQQINLQLKEAEWLKEKAFHHHECITAIQKKFTVLPMSFCTIFQNEKNLESFFNDQYHVLLKKLKTLKGKQEWNLKVFCETDRALDNILKHNPAVIELKEKLATMQKGKQFLMRKKLEHLVSSQLEEQQATWWVGIHQQLDSVVAGSNLRPNWEKDITGRNDDMIANCDFLIEKDNSERFITKLEQIEMSFEAVGCSFQVTGPWPPYHFSKMEREME